MDHKWLEDFLMLARERNFSKAAALRHVTQPQFSRRIRALELWAGAELVNRAGVPIALTPAGDTLLSGSKVAVNALADARERIANLGGGGNWTTLFTGRTLSRTVVPHWLAKVRKQLGERGDEVQLRLMTGSIHDGAIALAQILQDSLARAKQQLHLYVVTESDFAESLHEQALHGAGMAWLPRALVAADLKAGALVLAGTSSEPIRYEIRLYRPRNSPKTHLQKIWAASV